MSATDVARALLLAGLLAAAGGAASQALPYAAPGKHLGVVTCANSLCHGSVSPWKDSHILQNEYVTWSRVDKHATTAYHALFSERSKRIAANLKLEMPAHEAKLCLDCHAHNPPPARRGERFQVADGVSCEACHGPAGGWIRSHVEPGATHAGNVANGLYPLDDPVAQARLCLSCHFGNRDKFVTHRMMGAGHPRMSFELDTFTQIQPAHFVADEDWRRRKGPWDPVRTWAAGQALAASELLAVMLDEKRARDGLFPELVIFDCHACHRPMSERRWSPKVGTSPGRIRLNDSNFLMLRHIARRVLPGAEARELDGRLAALHRAVAGDGGDPAAAAREMQATLEALVPRIAAHAFTVADLRALARGLVEDGLDGRYHDYSGAEQATMAIASVMSHLAKVEGLEDAGAARRAMDRLHAVLRDDERYEPARFREALAALRATLGN